MLSWSPWSESNQRWYPGDRIWWNWWKTPDGSWSQCDTSPGALIKGTWTWSSTTREASWSKQRSSLWAMQGKRDPDKFAATKNMPKPTSKSEQSSVAGQKQRDIAPVNVKEKKRRESLYHAFLTWSYVKDISKPPRCGSSSSKNTRQFSGQTWMLKYAVKCHSVPSAVNSKKRIQRSVSSHHIPERPCSRVAADQFNLLGEDYMVLVDF